MTTPRPTRPTQEVATGRQQTTEPLTGLGGALRAALDGPYHPQRSRIREELDPAEVLRDPAMTTEQARAWTTETLARLSARGYGHAGFPQQHGGTGDLAVSVVDFEMTAHADLSLTVKSGVHFGLFGGAIANLGTEHHHAELIPRLLSMELPGCFAMTEVGHGSDVQSLETTLTHDVATDEIVVHSPTRSATKTYIGGAARDARMAVVFGQLVVAGRSHGIHAVLVPVRDEDGAVLPGVATGDNGAKGGLAGVDNGTLAFDQVRVPRRMLLDRYGGIDDEGRYRSRIEGDNRRFFTMLGTLVRGRVCVAGGAGVAGRKALSIATRYALQRRQFQGEGYDGEVLLLDYLSHQRKLLPAIATAYALGFAQNELTLTLQRVQGSGAPDLTAQRELETRAAGMKAVATRWANDTVQVCREACGGAGYMAENGLTVLRADADVFATFEGDNTVLLQLVAKGLLTHYSEMFGDLDMLGMVQFAARSFGGAVIERTAARPLLERIVGAAQRRSEEGPLLDRGWHVTMFEERERHVLDTLAQRMRTARKARGEDAFAAFNTTQDHVLMAARVHMDRVVLEAFVAGIDACADPAAREVLERLCDLYALSSLEADSGWFQAHNRMSAARAKAVTSQVNQLCADLRPDALALVEGMGVPTAWLGSAMLAGPQGG
ncbi:acyl-CoA dehydrogenase family protein [Ornithinicoccus halotolerans]|uniref:acyl-CoA dehydrogenase family protein n=1 Tax=Ornithinicoccus halotolerans TaxID=1748220 RepID=UPI001294D1EC|nr:acyl-CoA dehydrogenase [Ornithinicoccus halotolerans]